MATALRRAGVDVSTSASAGLRGASDEMQLAFAVREGRVLFTQDCDFLALHASGKVHAGIAYCRQTKHPVGALIRALLLLWEIYEPEEMQNRVEYL